MSIASGYHTLPVIDEATALAAAARASYESSRLFAAALGEPPLPEWNSLPEDFRHATIAGVLCVQQGASGRQCHDEWRRGKLDSGWRWGEENDEEQKISSYLLAWEFLTEAQRRKGELFVTVARSMLLACGATVRVAAAA